MPKNFPKLMTDTKSQIQEAQRTPTRINIKHDIQGYNNKIAEKQREHLERNQRRRNTLSIQEQG